MEENAERREVSSVCLTMPHDNNGRGSTSRGNMSAQKKDQIYHQLIDIFVEVLEPRIIQDVIQNKNYDFDGALEDLMTLTNNIGCQKNVENISAPQKQKSLSPEKTSSEEESSPRGSDEVPLTTTENLNAIKVSYTDVEEENEDADVIIEEENEFVFLNNDERKSNASLERTLEVSLLTSDFSSLFSSLLSKPALSHFRGEGLLNSQSNKKATKVNINPVLEQYQLIKQIPNAFDRVVMLIKENFKVLVLMRGCPGSGKSYLATTLMKKTSLDSSQFKEHILSTDDFFKLGKEFVFNPEKLSDAHSWNQRRVLEAVRVNRSPIIVDNTNTQIWEMRSYAAMAVTQGYDLEILEPETWWSFNERELTKRNVHSVPKKSIRNMLDRYEKNITAKELLHHFGLNYSLSNAPPQLVPNPVPICNRINNVKKRGSRGNRKKKIVSDETLTSGLPDDEGMSMLPSAPPQETSPSFQFSSDSKTFEDICTYYKSLRFDKSLHREDQSKMNESIDLISKNVVKESKNGKFETGNNCHLLPSTSVDEVAYGYTPATNDKHVTQSRQNITEIKQPLSSDPLKEVDSFKQTNCLMSKTVNVDKDVIELSLPENETFSSQNVFQELKFRNINVEQGELIRKLIGGELQECKISVLNSDKVVDNNSFRNDIIKIKESQTENDFHETHLQKVCSNQVNKSNMISTYPYTVQSLIQNLTSNVVNKENTDLDSTNISRTGSGCVQQSIQNKYEKLLYQNISRSLSDEVEKTVSDDFSTFQHCRNEKQEDTQNNDVKNLSGFTENKVVNENPIFGEVKQRDMSEVIPQEKITVNENTCRQFVMYSPEGLMYSDPIYITHAEDSKNKSEGSTVSSGVEISSVGQSENRMKSESSDAAVNSCFRESIMTTETLNIDYIKDDKPCQENSGLLNLEISDSLSSNNLNRLDNLHIISVPVVEVKDQTCQSVVLNEYSDVTEQNKYSKCILNYDGELKIDNSANSKNNEGNNKVLICEEDNVITSAVPVSSKPLVCGDSLHGVASSFYETDVFSLAEEKLPQIDIMSLFVGDNFSQNSVSSEKTKNSEVHDFSPKPERENIKKRIPSNSIFNYPITQVEISPDIALWDTVNDPHSLWNTSRDNKTATFDEQLKSGSKPQREFIKNCNLDNASETTDSSTNTSYTDFDSRMSKCGSSNEYILSCKNRNICEGIVVSSSKNKSTVLLLDKGTMTLDAEDGVGINLDELSSLFPQLQGDALIELVEKCQGDLNWALDLLLESDQVSLPEGYQSLTSLNSNSKEIDTNQETSKENLNLLGARKKIPKPDKKRVLKKSRMELKELIEKNIVLNESHYSDHVLKVMKRKRDLNKNKKEEIIKSNHKTEDTNEGNATEKQEVTKELLVSNQDINQHSCHNITDRKLEETTIGLPPPNPHTQMYYNFISEKQDEGDDEEDENLVHLAVGKEFIMQLQQKFGSSVLPDMIEDSSVIELPISLACQLHCYVLDSIQHQADHQQDIMDAMIREDEEFARQLQEQEDRMEQKSEDKPTPLLQEIMDMEMALAFYKADQDEWKQQSQNTMAAKLSMQLLTRNFPNLDKNVLMEIFHANNCSLHDTVESLNLALSDEQQDLVRREEELLAKLETVKSQEPKRCSIVVSDIKHSSNQRQEALQEAEEYRSQASSAYQLRNDCFKKAQEAFRSGNTSVASYYSQLAALYKDRTEFFNSQAAACLFHARVRSSTLDLHFLHVTEAVQVLDIFLDEEISQLNQSKKKKSMVYLITGRGLRSVGGVSRIKPIVQRRLRERKIIYNEMNPGMLSAVLTRNTQLTCSV